MIDCISTKMKVPFDVSQYDEEKLPLINISTGAVIPSDVCDSLLSAR